MSNKNAYEIRETMLALAKDYMDRTWNANIEYTKQMVNLGQKTQEELIRAMEPYSVEEMVKKADEMYKFVSNDGSK